MVVKPGVHNEIIMIESILHEHEAIQSHVNMFSHMMDDWEAEDLSRLEEDAGLVQEVTQRYLSLGSIISDLEEGFKRHSTYEEGIMAELVGKQIQEAIGIEHGEIQKQMKEIKYILLSSDPHGFITAADYIKLIIGNLNSLIIAHCNIEDSILMLVKKNYI
jgi:hypothetical protein